MKKRTHILLWLLLFMLVGCGGEREAEPARVVEDIGAREEGEEMAILEEESGEVVEAEAESAPAAASTPGPTGGGSAPDTSFPLAPQPEGRLIIKEAQMELLVENTNMAVNRVTDIGVGAGGYILSQRVWDDVQGHRHATMTLGVPVARFERVLQQLRRLGEVTNEEASGDDVTEEYVDLDSRLESLRTTHQRLLSFLEDAETVEEILALNERIAEVEAQLSQIQGRMNYLSDRAAFSTVTVMLEPNIPSPTPTPTMTPTPTPTPTRWTPGVTARQATVELQHTTQGILSFLIYYGIVCGPWLLLVVPLAYGGWRVLNRVDSRDQNPRA